MTLDEYLNEAEGTGSAFAHRCGLTAASISRIRRGGQNISIDVAKRIADATGGKVTISDLAAQRSEAVTSSCLNLAHDPDLIHPKNPSRRATRLSLVKESLKDMVYPQTPPGSP